MNVPDTIRAPGQWVNGPKEVPMARRRYQKGSLLPKQGLPQNGLWVGRWREDVIQSDGTIARPYKWEVLGTIEDYPTRKLALRLRSPFIHDQQSNLQSTTYGDVYSVCQALGGDGSFPAQAQHAKLNPQSAAQMATARTGQHCAQGLGRPAIAGIRFQLPMQCEDPPKPGGDAAHDVEQCPSVGLCGRRSA